MKLVAGRHLYWWQIHQLRRLTMATVVASTVSENPARLRRAELAEFLRQRHSSDQRVYSLFCVWVGLSVTERRKYKNESKDNRRIPP